MRINAFPTAAREIFSALVLPFVREHPQVHIDVVTEGRMVDVVAGGFDLGVRSADRVPQLHDPDSVPSIRIDVRPALDSPGALVDRIRATVRGSAAPRPAPEAAAGAASATSEVAREVERVHTNCSERMAQLKACANERECALAHIGLTTCIAKQVCAREAAAFEAMRGTADEKGAAARMSEMEDCVARWGAMASAGVGEPGH